MVKIAFGAAYLLRNNMRGATFNILVDISGDSLPQQQEDKTFQSTLKSLLISHIKERFADKIIIRCDTTFANDLQRIFGINKISITQREPTEANLAEEIYRDMQPVIKNVFRSVKIDSVSVFIDKDEIAIYKEDEQKYG